MRLLVNKAAVHMLCYALCRWNSAERSMDPRFGIASMLHDNFILIVSLNIML